ncbi:hypothetical protein M378DRAFT_855771 [Amanita muscaria Koide BX008]|uniref:Uncharacterized protein n=1 Tax=Amanita muscaria (strain Koide BX008) TaxID=946122 RepID=A0A0C2WIU7_AMAMK|nr:hypothetical protein M378DRAFT_855771 [Amanita muscaria Koide BX008]
MLESGWVRVDDNHEIHCIPLCALRCQTTLDNDRLKPVTAVNTSIIRIVRSSYNPPA